MNINDYISSGILEQYVLGEVSPQEKKEVECMSHIYPEIKEELFKTQIALEGLAMDNAIEVPTHIKKNIFELIEKESNNAKVVAMKPAEINTNIEKPAQGKYLIAASVIFIVASIALYAVLNANYKKETLALNTKIEALSKENETANKNASLLKEEIAIVSNANNRLFVLADKNNAPGKAMNVYWNKTSGKVYINNLQLPQTPEGKQYQLWALKGGKPIDLGVFDTDGNMHNMKNIDGAEAFAVTLENKGGSPTPHLDQLFGLVKVQG